MNYQEIYDEVVSLTNRPDLTAEINTAIKSATLRCHQMDFYERDVLEQKLVFIEAEYIKQVDVKSVLSRYRKIKYLRKWDPTGSDPQTLQATGAAGAFFDIIDPDQVLDSYNITKADVAYVAGSQLNIRSSSAESQFLCGWYASPNISSSGYSSWIADQVPYAIIYGAASVLFNMIGFQEQSRKFDSLILEQNQMVTMEGIGGKGR